MKQPPPPPAETLDLATFSARVGELSPEPLSPQVLEALHLHYRELLRWRNAVKLIGPGTESEAPERHFGESLAALALIPVKPPAAGGEILDVGSGAGFPGLVLAAARPAWRVTLVEARQRKWAFLAAVARRAALSCRCLNARVAIPLPAAIPPRIDLVTARAIRLPPEALTALFERLGESGRALLWVGEEDPVIPPGWRIGVSRSLAGSERRRIVELRRAGAASDAGSTTDLTADRRPPRAQR